MVKGVELLFCDLGESGLAHSHAQKSFDLPDKPKS